MKKVIALILVLAMALCFTACSHECASCGADGADNKVEDEYLCDDCYELVEGLKDLADELNDK